MTNVIKAIARMILKDEIAEACDERVIINHELNGARECLTKVLDDKKATKAMMTEAMTEALCHINEARWVGGIDPKALAEATEPKETDDN